MTEADPLELDTLSPVNDAIIVDRKDDMFIQHGGCATRLVFEEVEEMSVSEFLDELPLHPHLPDKELDFIRSPSTQTAMLLRGDRVIRYKGCQFQDVLVDGMIKLLTQKEATMVYTPMSQYPLVHSCIQGGNYWVTVQIPKRIVHIFGDEHLGHIDDDVTMPPLWFCVQMTSTFTVTSGWVAVVGKLDPDPLKCELRKLCFPNTYNDAHICFGSTRTDAVKYDVMTEGLAVAGTVDRFFNSMRNNHCLSYHMDFLQSCRKIYSELPKEKIYEKAISRVANDVEAAGFLRYLRILHEPDGWMRIDLPKLSSTVIAENFLHGA